MASSFASQIPTILHLAATLKPATILDIGKGFGKYGFLFHEYFGIDNASRPDPSRTLAAQSRIVIEAVECNRDYLWPHLNQSYRIVHFGRIEEIYASLGRYDLVLMSDVIEHLRKEDGLRVARHFVEAGSRVIISTPRDFFDQCLYESPDEHHLSHWTPRDFDWCRRDYQHVDGGTIYLLSRDLLSIRGFGAGGLTRTRRVARILRDCL